MKVFVRGCACTRGRGGARTGVELAFARVGLLDQDVGRWTLDEPAMLARDVGHHHAQAVVQVLSA